jgi:hypothetical protein
VTPVNVSRNLISQVAVVDAQNLPAFRVALAEKLKLPVVVVPLAMTTLSADSPGFPFSETHSHDPDRAHFTPRSMRAELEIPPA